MRGRERRAARGLRSHEVPLPLILMPLFGDADDNQASVVAVCSQVTNCNTSSSCAAGGGGLDRADQAVDDGDSGGVLRSLSVVASRST